jgi:hypothetical protein
MWGQIHFADANGDAVVVGAGPDNAHTRAHVKKCCFSPLILQGTCMHWRKKEFQRRNLEVKITEQLATIQLL